MAHPYYKPCPELTRCNDLIERYWENKQYEECFAGHMELAQKGYPLAECLGKAGHLFPGHVVGPQVFRGKVLAGDGRLPVEHHRVGKLPAV